MASTAAEPGSWVHVPGGTVSRRDARTGTTRTVDLLDFRLGRVTVTAADLAADRFGDTAGAPAAGVSWLAAVAWCNRASVGWGLAGRI